MNNFVSDKIKNSITKSSWIRKMFEKGGELKKKFGDNNVFDFSLGNPDVPPPVKFFETNANLAQCRNPKNHSYMPNSGYIQSREILARHLSTVYGKNITADNLVMTSGAAGAINIMLKSILNPHDEVILIAPYFAEYIFYIDNHNGIVKIAESSENFDIDISEIEKNLSPRTRAIIINSPNNPTGKVYTEDNLKKLAQLLEAKSETNGRPIYIISDEPYRKIIYDDNKVPSILKIYKNSLIANSYSKDLSLPGERIGYALINPDCAGKRELFDAFTLCNRICGFVNAPATM